MKEVNLPKAIKGLAKSINDSTMTKPKVKPIQWVEKEEGIWESKGGKYVIWKRDDGFPLWQYIENRTIVKRYVTLNGAKQGAESHANRLRKILNSEL